MNILPEEWQAILKKSLSDTFQCEQIISGGERLRRLESAVRKNICALHDLPPDDVVVSGRKDASRRVYFHCHGTNAGDCVYF